MPPLFCPPPSSSNRTKNLSIAVLTISVLIAGATLAQADTVTLTASDAIGTSSFNSKLHWSDGGAPGTGNDYVVESFLLRTPDDNVGRTFNGASLTLRNPAPAPLKISDDEHRSEVMDKSAFLIKGYSRTITINYFTIDGGTIRSGVGDDQTFTLAADPLENNGIHIASRGATFLAEGNILVASPISGSGTITLLPGRKNGVLRRMVTLSSPTSTFAGNIVLQNAPSGSAYGVPPKFTLAPTGRLNFAIGANGASNSISGRGDVTFEGHFVFDLGNAEKRDGNSWAIITVVPSTFGSSFSVPGWTQNTDRTWTFDGFTFDEKTGVLTYSAK